ncbi:alpha/beta hydrolase family esterase [Natribacillus halophilus]|uniref:Polyhydroxybutyrate depolymerase n=1 Tax=Natribacillus halophilus TaxID=549003 RepID=A0A1G8MX12_9BACI|nr:PHB depolymerase family esterase [Natribacillus halophilus]SDI72492.1 polyhydroxybutyrate depolymerase [Natribacillus halophilus]
MQKGKLTKETINIQGLERSFLYYVPTSYDGNHALPLLLSFHGAGSSAEHHSRLTKFHELAERENFFVIYPEATHVNESDPFSKRWNEGLKDNPAYIAKIDDVSFVQALMSKWQNSYSVDKQRIYTTGFSNGSSFSFRLAIECPNTFTAIAGVAGPLPKHLQSNIEAFPPLIFIMGDADPVVPFSAADAAGEKSFVISGLLGARECAEIVAYRSNHTKTERLSPLELQDPTRIEQTKYMGQDETTLVTFYHVKGGGHTWPGGPKVQSPASNGKVSQQMDASKVIWDTFKQWM